jgi:hypothetical protein
MKSKATPPLRLPAARIAAGFQRGFCLFGNALTIEARRLIGKISEMKKQEVR